MMFPHSWRNIRSISSSSSMLSLLLLMRLLKEGLCLLSTLRMRLSLFVYMLRFSSFRPEVPEILREDILVAACLLLLLRLKHSVGKSVHPSHLIGCRYSALWS